MVKTVVAGVNIVECGLCNYSPDQIIRQIGVDDQSEACMSSQGKLRGERDVIRLRNPTEDKRAFRRMLTSADRDVSVYSRD